MLTSNSGSADRASLSPHQVVDSRASRQGSSHLASNAEFYGDNLLQSPSSALSIDGLNSNAADLEDKIIGTVYVDIQIGIGAVKFNLTPSLNAVVDGCITSLKAVFSSSEEDTKKLEREAALKKEEAATRKHIRFLNSRRRALREVWHQIDADGSNELDQDEVKKVVLCLLEKKIKKDKRKSILKVGKASQITAKELNRELANFMLLVDENNDNSISFQELEDAMFKHAQNEDNKVAHFSINHGIVYFSSLREYCSPVIVHELTGSYSQDLFPPVVSWANAEGIDNFWLLFKNECGCSRSSLREQDVKVIQRKLVRLLQNYNFAKFCWETLVQPAIKPPKNDLHANRWLLDDDNKTAYNSGAMDILASHVHHSTLKKTRQPLELHRWALLVLW